MAAQEVTRQWTPTDGYFRNLLNALLGGAMRRTPGQQESGGSAGVGASYPVTPDTALRLSAVWACAKLISEAMGAMPLNCFDINKDGTRKRNNDHWLNGILGEAGSPNRYQTPNEFIETLVLSLMLGGNFYGNVVRRGSSGEVLSLLALMPSQTAVELTRRGERVYTYTVGSDVIAFAQSSIWHIPLMPTNGVIGLSPLQYGARSMGIAMAAEDRVSTLASNGFKPTGVLMIDRMLKPEQRDDMRAQFSDLAIGQGDPLKVLEAGMKYQQISMNPKDVQLLETRQFSTQDIARFFGVPSVLINDTASTTSWGSGILEIKEGFYTLTLQPLIKKIEASITKWLIPNDEKGKIEIEFDFAAFLAGNEKQRFEANAAALTSNQLTINEARQREGRASIGPEGDAMYAQMQMIKVGEKADVKTTAPQDKVF